MQKKLINHIKLIISISTIFLSIFLLGCTEMSREEKNLCYSLTTKSYAYISDCKTENTCFEEINNMFDTSLGYEQESKLYELKNNFGRSWFYYNNGINELKKISDFCKTGSIENLPGTINQTRFLLEEAFYELDQGILNSFEIISVQEQILTREKIDLLKEEDIYYSLIELRQILSDLETGNSKNNNYVSYFLDRVQKYNSSNASKKYDYLIEKDSFWIQAYNIVENAVLTKIGLGKKGSFPFISEYFNKIFSSAENLFLKEESLKELQKLPAKEFTKLYSDLAGKQNSSIKRFANLINDISKDYEKIVKELTIYWTDVEKLEKECSALLKEINNNEQFDFLEKELMQIGVSTKIDYEEILKQNKKKIIDLKEKKANSTLRLGEEISELKKVKNTLIEIRTNLKTKKEKNVELLKEKCLIEAQKIKNEKFEIKNETLNYLKQDLIFFANNVTKNNEEIFYYCEEMIKKKKSLIEGINNFEELENKKLDLTKDCFDYLEKMLPISKEYELLNIFENLKKEEVNNENLFYFNEACNSIKKQLQNTLIEDYFIKQIIQKLDKLIIEKELTEKINLYLNDQKIQKEIIELEAKIKEFEYYFENKKPKFEILFIKREKILDEISKELEKIVEKNNNYKIRVIEKLIKKEYLTNELGTINYEQEVILKIIINNPFEEIENKQSFFIKIDEGEIITKPENVEQIKMGENGFIILTKIPDEQTIIEIKLKKNILTNEEEKIIVATTQSGLIQRNIVVQTETINKLLIKTIKPENMLKCIIFIDEKEVIHSIQDNEIFFVGENIDNKTKIVVFIYTKKLINLEMNLNKNQFLSINSKKIEYNLIAKNLTNKKINGTIIIPINSNEKINKINIYDELMTNKQKENINGEVILKNQEFLEGQERKYSLILEIDSVEEYYLNQLEELLFYLEKNNEFEISEKIKQILLIEFNEGLIKDYEDLIKKGNDKKNEIDKEQQRVIDKQIKIEKIKELIEKTKNDLDEAKKLGFEEISEKLQKLINETEEELNSEKIDDALITLEKAVFDINSEIIEKVKELRKIKFDSDDLELENFFEKIIKNCDEIEKIIAFDPILAKEIFVETIELVEKYDEREKIVLKEQDDEEKLKKIEFEELLISIKSMINILEKQFDIENDFLTQIRFVFPITKSRLDKIKQTISLIEEYNENDLIKLKNIKLELQLALDEIKRFVILEFNNSVDKKINPEIIAKARKEIDSNNYISALLTLNSTAAQQDYFLIGIVPVLLIIIVAGIIKFNLAKKKEKKNELKQKVLEQWDEEQDD